MKKLKQFFCVIAIASLLICCEKDESNGPYDDAQFSPIMTAEINGYHFQSESFGFSFGLTTNVMGVSGEDSFYSLAIDFPKYSEDRKFSVADSTVGVSITFNHLY